MAVGDSAPDDRPDELATGVDAPRRDREQSGPGPTHRVSAADKENHVVYSSEDEHHLDIAPPLDPAEHHPADVDPEKTVHVNSRPPSRCSSSVFANTNIVVPRAQRRGLFGRFAIIPEVERPYEYKKSTKWMITAIVALVAAGAPMGSGLFLRESLPSISQARDRMADSRQKRPSLPCPKT
jgi:hypothetical protein